MRFLRRLFGHRGKEDTAKGSKVGNLEEKQKMSLLVERFSALDALADHREPAPSLYFMPHRFVFLKQIAQYLTDEFQRVSCRTCGKKGENWHVVEATKHCRYPEGWEKKVEDALSKLPDEVRANQDFQNTIVRQCRDQFQVADVQVSCKCINCGHVREWSLDSSFLDFLSRRHP